MARTSRRTRTTLAEGIYQDAHGVTVIARLGSKPNQLEAKERFDLVDNDGIPYSKRNCGELITCRVRLLDELKQQRAQQGGEAGSLGAAIDKWIAAHPLTPDRSNGTRVRDKRYDDHRLLIHWRASTLAATPVTAIKRSQVRAQLDAWTAAGKAPTTVNHRKRILADVLRWQLGADDDEDITLPTDGIESVAPRPVAPRGLPMPMVARILGTMPDRGRPTGAGKGTRPTTSETKIRLRVMAWTGLPQQSLERLERRRVNLRDGKLYFPPRQKAKGAPGLWVDLLPAAIDALRDYDRAGLWGKTFSRSSMRQSWRRAVTNTRKALQAEAEVSGDRAMVEQFLTTVPPDCRPYDTRHSFLSDVYRQTGDIRAVQEIGQHASLKTTDRYTKAAVPERVASAIDTMRARWFPDAPKPSATVREFHVVSSSKS